jgi:SAM-dependent methyltransferase
MPDSVYAIPWDVRDVADCHFYHSMEIPGFGEVEGHWDLRSGVDAYLGRVDFAGKRVLEIGPASGYLTMEMEKRGADVVALEVCDDPGWDFVPFPPEVLGPVLKPRRQGMQGLKSSFWLTHAAHHSKARVLYADAYNIPEEIGAFDVALMGSVLLHTRGPLQIVEQCAKRAATLIITDLLYPDLEGSPVCRLNPSVENGSWDTWWHFSSDFFVQFLRVLGYKQTSTTTHIQKYRGNPASLFTVLAQDR